MDETSFLSRTDNTKVIALKGHGTFGRKNPNIRPLCYSLKGTHRCLLIWSEWEKDLVFSSWIFLPTLCNHSTSPSSRPYAHDGHRSVTKGAAIRMGSAA
uniref:AlNc14C313G10515 protein n=1 Tax=Albugo laibachii Nc14 TaxID=890382 RepID=F0WW73_9STRA|nr:AlNc14C313G10515 [Albugo laibachii Nc14]|eukprot:CCA25692.1 AlNc14C313G10515 [Albugo laibachii Nc14]